MTSRGLFRDPTSVPTLLPIHTFHKCERWTTFDTRDLIYTQLHSSSAKRSVMLKQRSCFERGAKSQTRGFRLNRSKTLQMFIFWNCSPNFCIQVRDSASQGRVLQSWQHCPSAGPACSISWHALHRDAWRLTLAHPTEHNCGNCVRLLCTW